MCWWCSIVNVFGKGVKGILRPTPLFYTGLPTCFSLVVIDEYLVHEGHSMKIVRRLLTFLLIVVLTTAIAVACNSGGAGDDSAAPVRVGSKDFTEEFILGEMYALVWEN